MTRVKKLRSTDDRYIKCKQFVLNARRVLKIKEEENSSGHWGQLYCKRNDQSSEFEEEQTTIDTLSKQNTELQAENKRLQNALEVEQRKRMAAEARYTNLQAKGRKLFLSDEVLAE